MAADPSESEADSVKKILKIVISAVLSVVMLASSCLIAAPGGDIPSTVTFEALQKFSFEPGTMPYSNSGLFDGFQTVMPGDVLYETITVKNTSRDFQYVDIYLRAVPHDEVDNPILAYAEPEPDVASMNDFLAQLYMRVWNGDELIYEASPDKTAGLTENVLLGRFEYGDSRTLKVELSVPITMGNEYAHRIGEVDWAFYAEAFGETGGDGEGAPDSNDDEYRFLTVHKVWNDDETIRPLEVEVYLLCNGEVYDTAVLDGFNQWTYTWAGLDPDCEWTVRENVPSGYVATYDYFSRNLVYITNREFIPPSGSDDPDKPISPDDPDKPDVPDDPDKPDVPDVPDDPDKPDNPDVPGESGESSGGEGDSSGHTGIPEVTEPISMTVRKEWAGDEDHLENRPDKVAATLVNGTEAVETVWLGEHNNWTYTWKNLDPNGNYSILELDVPKGYTPSYSVDESGTVVITNTATLIETGMMSWHIPVLGGAGVLLVTAGLLLVFKKRKKEDA